MLDKLEILSTFMLCGLIWTIQLVHYPSFRFIELNKFTEFQSFHSKKITLIVAPLMLLELITALIHFTNSPKTPASFTAISMVATVWIVTAFISVPCHNILAQGYHSPAHNKLVSSNWIRTAAWSLRSALLLWSTH